MLNLIVSIRPKALHKAASNLFHAFERPNTIISFNCIICKVGVAFGPNFIPKIYIVGILQIIRDEILVVFVDY